MGAWDHTIFGNDTSCDWAFDLEKSQNLTFIAQTIEKVIEEGDCFDASDCEEALAAIDTIVRLRGHFYIQDAYTKPIDQSGINSRRELL